MSALFRGHHDNEMALRWRADDGLTLNAAGTSGSAHDEGTNV